MPLWAISADPNVAHLAGRPRNLLSLDFLLEEELVELDADGVSEQRHECVEVLVLLLSGTAWAATCGMERACKATAA